MSFQVVRQAQGKIIRSRQKGAEFRLRSERMLFWGNGPQVKRLEAL